MSEPIPRRYSMVDLTHGTTDSGKYLLYSNDLHHAYVIKRYDERGDLGVEQTDGSTRPIRGTFWRVLYVKPDPRLFVYADPDHPGKSPIEGIRDREALHEAAIEETPVLTEIDGLLPTRREAIQVALERYVARRQPNSLWAVYDRITASWPSLIAGRRIEATAERAQAEADADWLNRNYA